MDWVDELIEKWRRKLRTLSLRKAMIVYLFIAILLTISACAVTWEVCDSWQMTIRRVNGIESDYRYVGDGAFVLYFQNEGNSLVVREGDMVNLEKSDTQLWTILSVIQLLCIPVYSVGAIFLVSTFYYKNKLREPLSLLKAEIESIKRNDLSFSCFYGSSDEMGDICKTMDIMRKTVIDNQKNMWELMEEQRKINAAFAHDLRTPLTVISGYADMLIEYYPKGQISDEKMIEIFSSIRGQAGRLKIFSETMKRVDSFETLEVQKKKCQISDLEGDIQNFVKGLENENTPEILISMQTLMQEIYCDENLIMEVLGNLLSNAMRYGKKKIEILIEQQEDRLILYVKDDGRGMTKEELYKADSPYYSDKTKNCENLWNEENVEDTKQNIHFGLGLTICKILCKKHGGSLSFSNSVEGGAIVCAEFFVG